MWHTAGGNGRADIGAGIEDLGVARQCTGAISAATGMATGYSAGGLYNGIYIRGKSFVGNRAAINRRCTAAATAVFTARRGEKYNEAYNGNGNAGFIHADFFK